MQTLEEDAADMAAAHGMAGRSFAFAFAYLTWRQFEVIPREAVQTVGLALQV